MKFWKAVLFALGAAIVSAAVTSAKQEHDPSYPMTRTWAVMRVGSSDWFSTAQLDVVETAGVCVYILRGTGNTVSMQTVPKTQLPKGAGCQ